MTAVPEDSATAVQWILGEPIPDALQRELDEQFDQQFFGFTAQYKCTSSPAGDEEALSICLMICPPDEPFHGVRPGD